MCVVLSDATQFFSGGSDVILVRWQKRRLGLVYIHECDALRDVTFFLLH